METQLSSHRNCTECRFMKYADFLVRVVYVQCSPNSAVEWDVLNVCRDKLTACKHFPVVHLQSTVANQGHDFPNHWNFPSHCSFISASMQINSCRVEFKMLFRKIWTCANLSRNLCDVKSLRLTCDLWRGLYPWVHSRDLRCAERKTIVM